MPVDRRSEPVVSPSAALSSVFARQSKTKRDFRRPPKIPVTMNKRTTYKPLNMMHRDDLVKEIEQAVLSDKTRFLNKMADDKCWRNVNLSYRDHQYALGSIRQEQSMVYQLMCKVQKDKRRIQKQVHRRREKEFQNNMKWERVKNMCRFVVFKFRENVKRKQQERRKQEGLKLNQKETSRTTSAMTDSGSPNLNNPPVKKSSPKLEMVEEEKAELESKYASNTGSPQQRSEEIVQNMHSAETYSSRQNNAEILQNSQTLENVSPQHDIKHPDMGDIALVKKSNSETDLIPKHSVQDIVHSEHYSKVDARQQVVRDDPNLQTLVTRGEADDSDVPLKETGTADKLSQNQGVSKSAAKSKVIQVRKDEPSKPLTRIIHNPQENGSTVSHHAHEDKQGPVNVGGTSEAHPQDPSCKNRNSNEEPSGETDPQLSERTLNPLKVRRRGTTQPPKSYLLSNLEQSVQSSEVLTSSRSLVVEAVSDLKTPSKAKTGAGLKDGLPKQVGGKDSLAVLLKKRARKRAKKDLEDLNQESFVKYERTKSGSLKAYPGKRELFAPPTSKDVYNQQKLLKQERQAMLQQRLKLTKFYESVLQITERQIEHEKPVEKVKSKTVELPPLESSQSQMANSIFSIQQPEPVALGEEEGGRYVRVYDRDLKEDTGYNLTSRRMSSWNT